MIYGNIVMVKLKAIRLIIINVAYRMNGRTFQINK